MFPFDLPPPEPDLPEQVVRAARTPEAASGVPASFDVVTAVRLREMGPGLQLSEALVSVPGVVALDRRNPAQDLQLSIRGFGARSTFGVRGVRLYEDGIPQTMPDGQGQTSGFDLGAAQRVEVLRGPASVLFGNAAGGVVQVFSPDAPDRPELRLGGVAGPDGLWRLATEVGAQVGDVNLSARSAWQGSEGWREHSASQRQQWRARLKWRLGADRELLAVVSEVRLPEAQDPLGLTAEQLAASPRQAGLNAKLYDSRKGIAQRQAGLVHTWRSGASEWRLMAHGGQRQVTQFQAIPAPPASAAQTLPGHPGGVIDLDRRFAGLDARWSWQGDLIERPLALTAGWAFDEMREHRRGFQNFADSEGVARLGVLGALRRDEDNTARSADPYLQATWDFAPDWSLSAGLRHSHVRFDSKDRYIAPGNGDDSGALSFRATTPVLSLSHRLGAAAMAYVSAARSFETPTLNEVAYASVSGAQPGWNRGLRASEGTQVELGGKWQGDAGRAAQVALFQVRTQDEIGVAENAGGRSVFRNVGATQRVGLELSAQARIAPGWSTRVAAAWTRAEHLDTFAGRALPGVPRRTAWAELVWRPGATGWHSALSWQHRGRIWVNDANDIFAPAATTWSWRVGWRQAWSDWRLDTMLWVDNLTDERTVGSVIVNEASRRYFEPAPGRSATVSATLTRVF